MPKPARKLGTLLVLLVLALGALPAVAGVEELESEVREFTLDNGVHFLVVARHDVPVFAFDTHVDVGSANEVTGITGIAHILEHMAFKGTPEIGTTDYGKEKKAMAAEDAAFAALKRERAKGDRADPEKLAELEAAFKAATDAAREYVVSNEFGSIVENNGGRGMNAGTWTDDTNYFYMLPSNRLELWAYLEGSRMSRPVLREFYTEKEGPVIEERRMRTDNSPFGMLLERFQNLAFDAHPYHHSTIGWMSDLENISRQDCRDFYERNYVGENITIALVGDVDFDEVRQLAEKYFSGISDAPAPKVETVEPPQKGEKRLVVEHTAQPLYLLGYHRGSINDADAPVYDVIADILAQGRTSRLYTSLLKEKKLVAQIGGGASFPDDEYPNVMFFYAIPAKDVDPLTVEAAVFEEIDRFVQDGPTEEELAGVKQRAKANFVRSLRGNQGLARQLAYFQAKTGDWRNAFRQVAEIEAVTADDVRRVAAEIFRKSNRTVAYIETVEESS